MQNRAIQSVQLHIEAPLYGLPVKRIGDCCRQSQSRKKEISWQAVYYHDAFTLKANLQVAFKSIKQLGIGLAGTFFNADSAFDTRDTRKVSKSVASGRTWQISTNGLLQDTHLA